MARRGPPPGQAQGVLSNRHHRAAMLLAKGMSQSDVASILEVTRQTVSCWMKRDDFRQLVEREKLKEGHGNVIALVPSMDEALPPNWRELASESLAQAARPAVATIFAALQGEALPKAQIDTARWLVERLGIEAPVVAPPDEITTSDDLVRALADTIDRRVLEAALEAAG